MRDFLSQLWSVDPEAKLYRFPSELNTLPGMKWIHKHSHDGFFPKNKRKASIYFANHWIKDDGERSTTRALIGFVIPSADLFQAFTEVESNTDCWHDSDDDLKFFMQACVLQVADTIPVAWAHGTT